MTNEQFKGPQGPRIETQLGKMRLLCADIEEIGLEQQRLLNDDQLEEFVAKLSSRNPKIESLTQAGVLVEGLLQSDGVGVDQIESAQKQLDEMSAMIQRVMKRDAEQQIVVEKRRDELSKQLSGVGNTRSAIRAYAGGTHTPNPTLQDREG